MRLREDYGGHQDSRRKSPKGVGSPDLCQQDERGGVEERFRKEISEMKAPGRLLLLSSVYIVFVAASAFAQSEGCCEIPPNQCASPVSPAQCTNLGGQFFPNGTCFQEPDGRNVCVIVSPREIPSLSEWSAVVLVVLLIVSASIVLRQRQH